MRRGGGRGVVRVHVRACVERRMYVQVGLISDTMIVFLPGMEINVLWCVFIVKWFSWTYVICCLKRLLLWSDSFVSVSLDKSNFYKVSHSLHYESGFPTRSYLFLMETDTVTQKVIVEIFHYS